MVRFEWRSTCIPELYYCYIAGYRIEKLITKHGNRYSIGEMENALIKFESENMLIKFLTI